MAALAVSPNPNTDIRRFQIPDLDRHGAWMIPRIIRAHPHLDNRTLIGWLRALVYNNECLFLYQPNSVALAQVERAHTLNPRPIVRERFVFARDDKHTEEASAFYERFATWARQMGCDTLIVCEMTDVPEDKVKKILGRLFTRPQVFAKVQEAAKE